MTWRPTYRADPACRDGPERGTGTTSGEHGAPADHGAVGHVARRRSPTTSLRRTLSLDEPSYDDRRLGADRRAGPLALAPPAFADTDGPLLYRTRFDSRDRAGAAAERAAGSSSTASSTRATSGSTALPRRHRGLLLPPRVRDHRAPVAARDRAPARRRGHVRAGSPTARPSATSPASSSTGTASTPTGTPAASGVRCGSSGPARCASAACACSCREADADAGDRRVPRRARQRRGAAGHSAHDGRRRVEHERRAPARGGREPRRVDRHASTTRRCGGPAALGDQPLHDVAVEVALGDEVERPARACAPGCGQVTMRNWICSVNGERLFLKGANHGPDADGAGRGDARRAARRRRTSRTMPASTCCACTRTSARPELYDAADEAGLLLWQDMPLQWGYARGVRKQAIRQAREAVDLLGHHPSIAIVVRAQRAGGRRRRAVRWIRSGRRSEARGRPAAPHVEQAASSTASVKNAIERADGSRPVIAHSGVAAPPPEARRHRHAPLLRLVQRRRARLPAASARPCRGMARFVSEFGAQAVPADARLPRTRAAGPTSTGSAPATRTRCRRRSSIGTCRPRPTRRSSMAARDAGATKRPSSSTTSRPCDGSSTDRPAGSRSSSSPTAWPAVTWSVLGHDRQPKPGFQALVEACRPVIVVAERPPALLAPGRHSRHRCPRRIRPARAAVRRRRHRTARMGGRAPHVAVARRRARGRVHPHRHRVGDGAQRSRRDGPRPRAHLRRRRRDEPLPLDHHPP